MFILECCDGSYYTGSTKNPDKRLAEHQNGEGANHTKKRLPVKLLYYEQYNRIDAAFYREKQVQGWSRAKKEVLMSGDLEELHNLAICQNETHWTKRYSDFDFAQSSYTDEKYKIVKRSLSVAETRATG